MALQVLTANRLVDGAAVWYDGSSWIETLKGAEVARTGDDAARLEAIGKKAHADNLVVDVNLIDVEDTPLGLLPLRLRERIRAAGPTIDYVI